MAATSTSTSIRDGMAKVARFVTERPDKARTRSSPATATLERGLRCEVTGPNGERLSTDMPPALGGAGDGPQPGWLMRAGLAACNASCIAMRAAHLGIELSLLEVTVTSESDMRGFLGLDESVPAGLQDLQVAVRIAAPGRAAEELDALVRWACAHSPVGGCDPRSARIDVEVAA